jgi:hypothetical protein
MAVTLIKVNDKVRALTHSNGKLIKLNTKMYIQRCKNSENALMPLEKNVCAFRIYLLTGAHSSFPFPHLNGHQFLFALVVMFNT